MPISEKEFRQLKDEVEQAKSDADKAKGALDQLMSQLKEEFDCDNLEEAKTLLKDFEKKRSKAAEEFEREMKTYQKKWKKDDN